MQRVNLIIPNISVGNASSNGETIRLYKVRYSAQPLDYFATTITTVTLEKKEA